jgi:hypothetical protein
MNTLEIDLLARSEREVAELEKIVATFVQRERRLPGYDDLVRHCREPAAGQRSRAIHPDE